MSGFPKEGIFTRSTGITTGGIQVETERAHCMQNEKRGGNLPKSKEKAIFEHSIRNTSLIILSILLKFIYGTTEKYFHMSKYPPNKFLGLYKYIIFTCIRLFPLLYVLSE